MHGRMRVRIAIGLAAVWLAPGAWASRSDSQPVPADAAPVTHVGGDVLVTEWVLLGPFPITMPPAAAPPDDRTAARRKAFNTDHLESLGGEARAAIGEKTEIALPGADSRVVRATRARGTAAGDVALSRLLSTQECAVGYAFGYLESPVAQKAYARFGSDDNARVWVGGKRVHDMWTPGRGLDPDQDHFSFDLQAGLNPVLIKVENGGGPWGFRLRVLDEAASRRVLAADDRRERLQILQDAELNAGWRFVGPVGELPEVTWKYPLPVKLAVGEFPLKTRWFGVDLEEVERAEKPGRYIAYVTGTTPDGIAVRRSVTFYCYSKEFHPSSYPLPVHLPHVPHLGPAADVWAAHQTLIDELAGGILSDATYWEGRGAVWLAGLAELRAETPASPLNDPRITNQDQQLRLKLKLLGVEGNYPTLRPPQEIRDKPATVLREGRPGEAGVAADYSARLAKLCEAWAKAAGEPLSIVVARHGVIAHQGAYGAYGGKPATVDTPLGTASITKAVTGLVFAQFLDQGLMNLEDPVGKFLPDLPTDGPHAITFRQCFTHTTNLDGHGRWGGMDNAWLENTIANNLDVIQPGKRVHYSGMGYDLVGKAMEIVSGKSIFRLMEEGFFRPLECEHTSMEDMAYGLRIRAIDLAKMAQLLLSGGAYGDRRYFSAETAKKLHPVRLADYYAEYESVEEWAETWGVGLTWNTSRRAADSGSRENELIFSPHTLGHGSAYGAWFMVDLDRDLIVVMVRNATGEDYSKYANELLQAIVDGLVD